MNTKKIESGSTPKGGKDNTRVVLTAAGAVAVGAVGGAGAASLLNDDDPEAGKEQETHESQTQNTQEQEAANAAQAQEQQAAQQQAQPQPQPQPQAQPQPQPTTGTQPTPIATDQPNGNTGGAATGGSTATTGGSTTGGSTTGGSTTGGSTTGGSTTGGSGTTGDVDAEALAVAQQLVGSDDIDPNDIDGVVAMNFEDTDIIYTEDGSEIPVALVTTPDDGQYMLADVDGDRVYDMVYDMEGNLVAGVEAGLNTNDAQLALNDDNGYIPITDDDPVFDEHDAEGDIVALGSTDNNGSVMEEITDDEDIFEEEPVEEVITAENDQIPATGLEDYSDLEADLIES